MTSQNPVGLVNEGGNREPEFLHAAGKLADLLLGMGPRVFGRGPKVLDRHELKNVRQLVLGGTELSIEFDGLVGFVRTLTVLGHGSFLARTLVRKAHFGIRFWMLPTPHRGAGGSVRKLHEAASFMADTEPPLSTGRNLRLGARSSRAFFEMNYFN
jgi:hypothetical protein